MENKIDANYISDLQKILKSLSMCIDPTTQIKFTNDSILSLPYVSKALNEVIVLLDSMKLKSKKNVLKKQNFYLSEDYIKNAQLSDDPISISKFTFLINKNNINPLMKKLKATVITEWLFDNKYLTIENDKHYFREIKKPTQLGKKLGIRYTSQCDKLGNLYNVNLYDKNAQNFILLKLNEIIHQNL